MKKKLCFATILFGLGLLTTIQFTPIIAASELVEFSKLQPSDIQLGKKYTSNQYMAGIMGTRQVVKISNDEATAFTYHVGALLTDYIEIPLISSIDFKTSSGYTSSKVITTQLQISALMESLVGVGASVVLPNSVTANYSQSKKMQTQVTGSYTEMNSTSYSENTTIDIGLDISSIDKSKGTVSLGYVVEYVRFTVGESYDEENRIFVGWTKKNNTVKSDYYGYVFTYTYLTWIYDNGETFGTVGNIRYIQK